MKLAKITALKENKNLDSIRSRRVAEYRRLADIGDDEILTEDTLNKWAFHNACAKQHCTEENMREALFGNSALVEDVTIAQAAKEVNATLTTGGDANQIEAALDRALKTNLRQSNYGLKNYQNILLIGEAGTGKSSIVRQWARDNNINLFEVRAAGMDATDLGGAISPSKESRVVDRLASTEFDKLERPRSVLFLDEYNRAPKEVRTNLLELVNSHVIPDAREDSGQRFLPNFLFTIAAINPPSGDYDVDTLDDAESSRFRHINVQFDPNSLLKYLTKFYDSIISKTSDPSEALEYEGRKGIAKTLLSSPDFAFDTRADMAKGKEKLDFDYLPLNYRSLTALLEASDGTKADVLELWSDYCNPLKLNMATSILRDYVDVDDKANSAIKGKSNSSVFRTTLTNSEKLKAYLDDN